MLDEQQRRFFAGLESIKLGHGGDTILADFLGLAPHTVARGRQQPWIRMYRPSGLGVPVADANVSKKRRRLVAPGRIGPLHDLTQSVKLFWRPP